MKIELKAKEVLYKRLTQLHRAAEAAPFLALGIQSLIDKLNCHVFKVVVVGQFSAGKSTFLNALMGAEILATHAKETTATSTRIYPVPAQDARGRTAKVHFRAGEARLVALDQDAGALKTYTSLLQQDLDVAAKVAGVDVFWPLPAFDESVCLVDTPGDNGLATHVFEATKREVQESAAVIFLMPSKGISDTDRQLIDFIHQFQDRMFFVVNQIDVVREAERAGHLQAIAADIQATYQLTQPPQVYGLSALDALNARIAAGATPVDVGPFGAFEADLMRFLASSELALGFLANLDKQADGFEQDIVELQREQARAADKEQERLLRLTYLVRSEYRELEQTLRDYLEKQNRELQEGIDALKAGWTPAVLAPAIPKLEEHDRQLLTELRACCADEAEDIAQEVRQLIGAWDIKELTLTREVLQSFLTIAAEDLKTLAARIPARNRELMRVALQFDEGKGRRGSDAALFMGFNALLSQDDFEFRRFSLDEFQQQLGRITGFMKDLREEQETVTMLDGQVISTKQQLSQAKAAIEGLRYTYRARVKALGDVPALETKYRRVAVSRSGFFGRLVDKFSTKYVEESYGDDARQKAWLAERTKLGVSFESLKAKSEKEDDTKAQHLTQLRRERTMRQNRAAELQTLSEQAVAAFLETFLKSQKQVARQRLQKLEQKLDEYVRYIEGFTRADVKADYDRTLKTIKDQVRAKLDDEVRALERSFLTHPPPR